MEVMTHRRPSLSDPDYAAFAWRRYRRLMAWMTLAAVAAVAAALIYLRASIGPLPWPIIMATAAGIGLSVLLAAALMGLIFLSSGTGHDEDVADFEDKP
jgi:ferric-dicitrate binding protein FerR (iron transport regulator)